jgi:hypothetical protein
MAVFDAQALDQLGRVGCGGGELLAEPFGQSGGERIDLPNRGLAVAKLLPPWVGGCGHPWAAVNLGNPRAWDTASCQK